MNLFLVLTVSLFITTLSYAGHPKNSQCFRLMRNAKSNCDFFTVRCEFIGACHHKRNTCSVDIKSKAGCESFKTCLQDTDGLRKKSPQGLRKEYFNSPCEYEWSPYGTCRIKTSKDEFMNYPTCPGRKLKMDGVKYNDSKFDCTGQAKIMKVLKKECRASSKQYENQCSKVKGYESSISEDKKCKYENLKFSPPGTLHKGAKSIHDGN